MQPDETIVPQNMEKRTARTRTLRDDIRYENFLEMIKSDIIYVASTLEITPDSIVEDINYLIKGS